MKIAVISDIHENLNNLALFFKDIESKDIEYILCLWDLINNWIAKILAWSPVPVFSIWWNNDWTKVAITKTSMLQWANLTMWETVYDFIELDWKKIFMSHYPVLAQSMAKSWDYDVVLYGHDHNKNIDMIWDCLIMNPWEISSHKSWICSYGIYDTMDNKVELIELDWNVNVKTDLAKDIIKKIKFKYSATKFHKYWNFFDK